MGEFKAAFRHARIDPGWMARNMQLISRVNASLIAVVGLDHGADAQRISNGFPMLRVGHIDFGHQD